MAESEPNKTIVPNPFEGLSETDLKRLRDFKLRYRLAAHGFTPKQAQDLIFTHWLYRTGRISN